LVEIHLLTGGVRHKSDMGIHDTLSDKSSLLRVREALPMCRHGLLYRDGFAPPPFSSVLRIKLYLSTVSLTLGTL
jgi:hypothetical protein